MRITDVALIAAALCLVAPATIHAQTMAATDYVKQARAADLYEIRSARFMLTWSRNPAVVRFADMMMTDHQASSAELARAAARDRVRTGKGRLDPDGRQMIAQLKAATGAERDRLYLDQQATAHERALVLHRRYSAVGTSPSLMAAADQIAPVTQQHLDSLRELKSAM